MPRIALSDMLYELRSELDKAQRDGDGKAIKFEVEAIDLELQITTTREGQGKGGIKLSIFNAEVGGKASKANTQTLRLRLKPKDGVTGGDLKVEREGVPRPREIEPN